ncbi:hypothetical protein ACTQ45_02820 [Fundicoccus sp. Sow4_D5]|uniref:hypothetical protein n=1 Tax=Fundicoccus sp. Sow4_D5 TaxID=3438782 RepID=UPI003F9007E8
MGRIVYACSSQQLNEWSYAFDWPESPIEPLPIQAIIRHVEVDGPAESLIEEVKQMHIENFQRKNT